MVQRRTSPRRWWSPRGFCTAVEQTGQLVGAGSGGVAAAWAMRATELLLLLLPVSLALERSSEEEEASGVVSAPLRMAHATEAR